MQRAVSPHSTQIHITTVSHINFYNEAHTLLGSSSVNSLIQNLPPKKQCLGIIHTKRK